MDPRVESAVGRVTDRKVPDELTRGVHDANARLHDARQRLDALIAGDRDYDHQTRVDALAGELREAERAVEQADQAVHDHLGRPG